MMESATMAGVEAVLKVVEEDLVGLDAVLGGVQHVLAEQALLLVDLLEER